MKINTWLVGLILALSILVIGNTIARPSAMDIVAEKVFDESSAVAGNVFITARTNAASLCQFDITGTATLCVKGRVSPDAPWVVLASRSTSGAVVVPAFPEMIVECTAYTSGNVKAWFAVSSN